MLIMHTTRQGTQNVKIPTIFNVLKYFKMDPLIKSYQSAGDDYNECIIQFFKKPLGHSTHHPTYCSKDKKARIQLHNFVPLDFLPSLSTTRACEPNFEIKKKGIEQKDAS